MSKYRNKLAGKVALAASATLLAVALPSSVLAISLLDGETGDSRLAFTPASADPEMAKLIAERSGARVQMMRFTPASAATSGSDRSVTVAVRFDRQIADALTSRTSVASSSANDVSLRVTPMRYNLGIARGYSSFAQAPAASAPALSGTLSNADIPDISDFATSSSKRDEPSRFAARVALEEGRVAGRADSARETVNDQMLDVGGSFRLTNNLDITAGVRYEQDRDLVALPDVEQQDSQAVYIGTQFRF